MTQLTVTPHARGRKHEYEKPGKGPDFGHAHVPFRQAYEPFGLPYRRSYVTKVGMEVMIKVRIR